MGVTAPRLNILPKPSGGLGDGSRSWEPELLSGNSWMDGGGCAGVGVMAPPPSANGPTLEAAESARRLVLSLSGDDDDDEKTKDGLRPNEGLRSLSRVFCWRGLPPAMSSPELVGRWDLLAGGGGDGGAGCVLELAPPPPPKRDEKKGAALCVGVAAERCMSCVVRGWQPRSGIRNGALSFAATVLAPQIWQAALTARCWTGRWGGGC